MSHKLHTFCFVLLTIHYVHLGALCSHSNCQIRFYGPDCQHNFHFTSPSLSSILSLMVLISLPPTYFCTFLLSLPHIILNRFFFFFTSQAFSVKYLKHFSIKFEIILKITQCALNWVDLICRRASWK